MSSNATDLQNRLILAVERKYPKSRIFRQNTGSAYPIQTFKRAIEYIKRGVTPVWFRPVAFGTPGQGDVGGWIHINGVAVVCHIEVKIGKDTQREAQEKFEATVKRCGGIYVIANDLDQGLAALAEAVTKIK
jgi:hypothetical protein